LPRLALSDCIDVPFRQWLDEYPSAVHGKRYHAFGYFLPILPDWVFSGFAPK
jgi:hypothetical protein